MLEIELMNRACAERFRSSHRKLAFLPHYLRDLEANCVPRHATLTMPAGSVQTSAM
jgi:hypothetical protein